MAKQKTDEATVAAPPQTENTPPAPPTGSAAKTANVRLAAKAEPLGAGAVTVGMRVICELPDGPEQRAGFYCEEAATLLALYPDRYKRIVDKGE